MLSAQYGVDDSNEVFSIDDLGNRSNVNLRDTTDVNYVIDNLTNRYTSIDSNAPQYDNAGKGNYMGDLEDLLDDVSAKTLNGESDSA